MVLNQLDQKRKGHLTLDQFREWHKVTQTSEKDVLDLFNRIDEGNDGFLTSDDLFRFFKNIIIRDPQVGTRTESQSTQKSVSSGGYQMRNTADTKSVLLLDHRKSFKK